VRKSLIILMVCVLGISGMGAAFATDMDFTNVGSLSLEQHSVPQVNVTHLYYHIRSDTLIVVEAILSFDVALGAGSQILVSLMDGTPAVIDRGLKTLDSYLAAGSAVTILLEGQDQLFTSIVTDQVTVLPSFAP